MIGRQIDSHAACVLVSYEYNYGMSGVVKNAFDFAFGPWKERPIAIVTYGLDGGKTLSEQFNDTLGKMSLKVSSTPPQFAFVGGLTGADTGPATLTGKLVKESLDRCTDKAAEDVMKAIKDVVAKALSLPTGTKA
ncbi:uncharacterized protein A1O9_07732 [Exophiala aquamarina CBS 119918]|uniref:NADPH-dependent FMN reductase-like domain-containing protein n=1 Tax=Exophiala aquamarina CBS 119918 TaxID=1182545 RepID=A0A072P8E8_9EURO|nr:uncharacterized protein A1O9_07732 [Exophiala aquamarina CBS 119918]KEF56151.1 hypothetical protein A1O9_07732 [Exophiala aquamarina CBS 119918]